MKKCVLASMLLVLITYSVALGFSADIEQYSFNSGDEATISTVDTTMDSNIITESVQTIIPKWQTKVLFPQVNSTHVLKGKYFPFKFISHALYFSETSGFINAVQHQSNYLS